MCGIVGAIAGRNVTPILMEGLKRLEYRGYDSAGIAISDVGELRRLRREGKLHHLEEAVAELSPSGFQGIAHTRWATHGVPSETNAHPHTSGENLAVVHNGIIENYLELKHELETAGHTFETETDTEVIAHLVEGEFKDDGLENAVRRSLQKLRGLFGIVLVHADDPGKIVAVRNGPPIVIGLGDDEFFVASDVPAILSHTRNVVFLGDEEMAILTRAGSEFTDYGGQTVSVSPQRIQWDPVMAEKAGYKHFMRKEIFEQPWALQETVLGRVYEEHGRIFLGELELDDQALQSVEKVVILACGTSWHAALVGKFLIEQLARIQVEVDYGSEYRYRDPIGNDNTLAVVITQSGETADTLAALREAKTKNAKSIAICNVVGSMATRDADGIIYTHAGPEIGVASTKAFTSQLLALNLLALHLGRVRNELGADETREHIDALTHLPGLIEQVLKQDRLIETIAKRFYRSSNFLYLGRGINYPVALEGALKLKEISYIHAEGYPAGEMKHGPIALIDENLPVVALVPQDKVFDKMRGNLQEAKTRGAAIIVVSDAPRDAFEAFLDRDTDYLIPVPSTHSLLTPIPMVVPLQLLAYHIAVLRGCDVDQPRNLAKSVTVE